MNGSSKTVKAKSVQYLDETQPLRLPQFEELNGDGRSSSRARCHVEFDAAIAESLEQISQNSEVNLFILFVSGVTLVLSRYTAVEDLVLGTLAPQAPHEPRILRQRITEGLIVNEYLDQIRDIVLEAFNAASHDSQNLSGKVAAQQRKDLRKASQVVCLYSQLHPAGNDAQETELLIVLRRNGGRLEISCEYDTALYNARLIERFLKNVAYVTGRLPRLLQHTVRSVDVVSPEEKAELLSFNETAVAYLAGKTIQELFEEQVAAHSTKPALAFGNTTISYKELNEKANALAGIIRPRGIRPGDRVALIADFDPVAIVSIIAIAKSGGCYVPISPAYPDARKKLMIERTGASLIVTTSAIAEALSQLGVAGDVLITDGLLDSAAEVEDPPNQNQPDDPFFVPFTSGTTGEPNAVLVSHKNIVRLAKSPTWIDLTKNDRILSTSTLQFDASTFEIWAALLNGLTLVRASKEETLDPHRLKTVIAQHDVTVLWLTSPLFSQLANEDLTVFERLKILVTGGDVVSASDVNRVRRQYPRLTIINGYGPTENTTFSTTFTVDREYKTRLPIGKPIANSTAYIVDAAGNLQPIGVTGELKLGGDGVAKGYLNNPALTAERFGPFLSEERVYATGDLARWLPDGNIDFIGRIDDQIKIRGYRIEPREIEFALKAIPQIEDAVVIGRTDASGEKTLCAYVVTAEPSLRAIKQELAQRLPDYMVPAHFVFLKKLPLTAHGKIDRQQLPEPSVSSANRTEADDETEKEMTAIWKEVLGLDHIGLHDDFFDIGGHSMKAIRLTSLIHKRLGVKLGLEHVLKPITIAELAAVVRELEPSPSIAIHKGVEREYYELSVSQQRLMDLYQLDPQNAAFNICQRYTWTKPLNEELVRRVLASLVERHESLRTWFPEVNGKHVQAVSPSGKVNLETFALAGLTEEEREATRNSLAAAEETTPFRLEQEPLYRIKLLQLSNDESDLLWTMHHIVSDGWSMDVLEREFRYLYQRYEDGKDNDLEPVSLQFKDYVVWHNELLADESRAKVAQRFWRNLLGEPLNPVMLPHDFPKCESGVGRSSSGYHAVIDEQTTQQLRALAKSERTSLFVVLFTAFNVLLAELSNQPDIITGIPSANRHQDGLRNTVGFLVDSLIVRNRFDSQESTSGLLAKVHENTLKSLDHAYYPIELACKSVGRTWPEILSTFFNMSTFGDAKQKILTDTSWHPVEQVQNAKLELVFYLNEYSNGVEINAHYYNELFKPETIERFMRRYDEILKALAARQDWTLQSESVTV